MSRLKARSACKMSPTEAVEMIELFDDKGDRKKFWVYRISAKENITAVLRYQEGVSRRLSQGCDIMDDHG